MHSTNQAANAMLSLGLMESPANSVLEQSWEQNNSNQEEDGEYLSCENNQEVENQETDNQEVADNQEIDSKAY